MNRTLAIATICLGVATAPGDVVLWSFVGWTMSTESRRTA